MAIDERVGVSVDSLPLAVRSAKDLGDAQFPPVLGARGVGSELDGASLDEGHPRDITAGAAVQELDASCSATPLGGNRTLALCRLRPTPAVAAQGSEDRPVRGQRVRRAIAVDPGVVVSTAALEQLGGDRIVSHVDIMEDRHLDGVLRRANRAA
jgi:hypothetical protein